MLGNMLLWWTAWFACLNSTFFLSIAFKSMMSLLDDGQFWHVRSSISWVVSCSNQCDQISPVHLTCICKVMVVAFTMPHDFQDCIYCLLCFNITEAVVLVWLNLAMWISRPLLHRGINILHNAKTKIVVFEKALQSPYLQSEPIFDKDLFLMFLSVCQYLNAV